MRQPLNCKYIALILAVTICCFNAKLEAMSVVPQISSSSSNAGTSSLHSVAVIGGGIAGLSCAHVLSTAQESLSQLSQTTNIRYDVTVFDTGRLRAGGRCAARLPGDKPKDSLPTSKQYPILSQALYDHAAQVITVPTYKNNKDTQQTEITQQFQDFAQQVSQWEKQGVLTSYPPSSLYSIKFDKNSNGNQIKLTEALKNQAAYYGSAKSGLSAISEALLRSKSFRICQDVWVSPSNGLTYVENTKKWRLQASGKVLGYFDHVVIAHNGKCADRITSTTPAKRVNELLKVNFAPTVPEKGGKKMTLSSIYSLTLVLPHDSAVSLALPETFMGGFIQNEPDLSFLAHQSRKYPLLNDIVGSKRKLNHDFEVWTVLSSPAFAKKHKGPQEFLPEGTVTLVTTLMLEAIERSLGLPANSIDEVLESRLQLWGAGLPLNTWQSFNNGNDDIDNGFVYDAEHALGVCGDWLVHPSVGGAYTSGVQLAKHLLSQQKDCSKGLNGKFVKSAGAEKTGIVALTDPKVNSMILRF